MRRKIIILIMLIIMLVTSCTDNINEHEINNRNNNTNSPKPTEADNVLIINYIMPEKNDSNAMDEWVQYIYENYDIELKCNDITLVKDKNLIDKNRVLEMIDKGEMSGIVAVDRQTFSMIENPGKYFIQLSDYLDDTEWKMINEKVRSLSVYSLDKAYAIAQPELSISNYVTFRAFNVGLQDENHMAIPTTLSEFREFLMQIDINNLIKESDITPVAYEAGKTLYYFEDIFAANGCTAYNNSTINYSIHTDSFEDAVLVDGMPETLEYLVSLKNENLIRETADVYDITTIVSKFDEGSVGSIYYPGYKFYSNNSTTVELSPAITGMVEKNIIPFINYEPIYAVAKNTINPKKTINDFVKLFYSDNSLYYSAIFGINNYVEKEYSIQIIDRDYYDNAPRLFSPNKVKILNKDTEEELMEKHLSYIKAREIAETAGLIYFPGLQFFFPYNDPSREWPDNHLKINSLFNIYLSDVMAGTESVQGAIDAYIVEARKMGVEDYLDKLNEKYGSEQKYFH